MGKSIKELEQIAKLEKARLKHLSEQELFRRRYYKLDDESRRIRNMSDYELENLTNI